LHELALEEEKYRQQIAQILCSYVRSKTNEMAYQETYTERPSNEIQTTLNLLFKEEKCGLYTQDFAKVSGFPKADLSHAYLVEANFQHAQCQGASFEDTQCQGANFFNAQCQRANFFDLCILKTRPLTLCTPKTRFLALRIKKNRPLTLCTPKNFF
jgi:hypothetical protein